MKKLVSIPGEGFGYACKIGIFEVKFNFEAEAFHFDKLKEAKEFYDKHN